MTTKPPFFSIITITKNNLTGLKQTAQSLLSQTNNNYEWIVIDGHSDDGTQAWLAPSSADWISEPDTGIYNAMNKGIERAKGQYLFFLNAGDQCANNNILESIKSRVYDDTGFVYGDSLEEIPKGVCYKKARRPHPLAFGMFTHHQAMLYKRSKLGEIRYDESYKIAGDYDFTVRFLKTKPQIVYIDHPICIFASGGISQKQAKLGRSEQYQAKLKNQICAMPAAIIIYMVQTIRFFFKSIGREGIPFSLK